MPDLRGHVQHPVACHHSIASGATLSDPVIISSYARTPIGGFQGKLSTLSAVDLGSFAVKAAVERSGIDPQMIERVYLGYVLPAGLGQAPARQAALRAGLPHSVEGIAINKMCGSGMQATIMASEALASGAVDIVVAGGMESMTNAPYALPKHRLGARIGHDRIIDTMTMDGLEDTYSPGKPMGAFAQDTALDYQFAREAMDAYAVESLRRANAAINGGAFVEKVVPVTVKGRAGDTTVAEDEQLGKAKPEKIATLKPALATDGTITAATSASISDGAAAMVITRASVAKEFCLVQEARIVAMAAHAHAVALFTTAPVLAIRKLLAKVNWGIKEVDLFEINEAFAAVPMIVMCDLAISHDRINVNGGATALGHPIGASGARIIVTLIAALKARGKTRGVAALCLGGGEATAVAIELV